MQEELWLRLQLQDFLPLRAAPVSSMTIAARSCIAVVYSFISVCSAWTSKGIPIQHLPCELLHSLEEYETSQVFAQYFL